MEKIVYLLWSDQLASEKQTLAEALKKVGAQHVRVNVADDDITAGSHMQTATSLKELPSGIVTFWLNSSFERQAVESVLDTLQGLYYGYSVCESEPLPNIKHPPTTGVRCEGFNQIVLLKKPDHLSREKWLDIWLNNHTRVAIDTQQTFGYRQNIVVRRFDENAPELDAIIEENFPIGALNDDKVFYAANIDGEKTMIEQMMDSCLRFIDFTRMNRLITSEYNY